MSKKFKKRYMKKPNQFKGGNDCCGKCDHSIEIEIDAMGLDTLIGAVLERDAPKPIHQGKNREYHYPQLTIEERGFLKHVIRPFRDVITAISIQKGERNDEEFLSIAYVDGERIRFITFPPFKKYRQYKGVERGVDFKLNDLDL